MAFFVALTPFTSGLINIPIALYLILTNNPIGWVILFIQIIFINSIDGVLRPRLVSKDANIHPILVLLSVLGGIIQFGIWGLVLGPILMVLFLTTLDVYQAYYKDK